MNSIQNENSLLYKIGIPPKLAWGYLGLLIFMVGDGVETGWISPYLVDNGFTVQQVATLLTIYGVSVAIAAWFSGILVQMFGPRKTMTAGLIIYLFGSITFIHFGLGSMDTTIMYPTYALRGLGFPLFAYSFLVWVNYSSPRKILGSAVGWFWFAYSGGLFVMGAFSSAFLIPTIGHVNTLWTSVAWGLIGAFFTLIVNRDVIVKSKDANSADTNKMQEFLKGFTIVKKEPKVLIGGIVRIINSVATFGFPVFLPMYMVEQGYNITQWLQIWGSIFTANIIFNLIFGFVGDKFGWRRTIMWFGCIGTGLATLALYYLPQIAPGNIPLLYFVGIVFGGCLAGFVPLSALVPSLVKDDKGAALSILNLGSGSSRFVGPIIVGALIGVFGATGVVWCMAGVYFAGAILTKFLTLDESSAHKVPTDTELVANEATEKLTS